jgi:hypothetical protein
MRISLSRPPTSRAEQEDGAPDEDEDEDEDQDEEESQEAVFALHHDGCGRDELLSGKRYRRIREPSNFSISKFDTEEPLFFPEDEHAPLRRLYGRPRKSTLYGMDPSQFLNLLRDPRSLGAQRPQQPVSLDMVWPNSDGFRAHTPRTDETPDSLLAFRHSPGQRSASLATISSGPISASVTEELRRNFEDLGIGARGPPSPPLPASGPVAGFRGTLPRSNDTPELDISFPKRGPVRRRF